jgi:hypothetical protein
MSKFEDILPLMRCGKKAQMTSDRESGVYWICGKAGNESLGIPMTPTIIKIQKDDTCIPDRWSWGIPCWAVMADDWEIMD